MLKLILRKVDQILCKIETLNLIELKKIKEIINNAKMIKKMYPFEISYNNSSYNLLYYGNLDILIKSLKKNKINLITNKNKCNIKIL